MPSKLRYLRKESGIADKTENDKPVYDLVPIGLNLVYGGILKCGFFSVAPANRVRVY